MALGQAYVATLTPQMEEALERGSLHLINSGFADLLAIHDVRLGIADAELTTYLPGRYLPRYTIKVLQKFLVCIIIVEWKLAQSTRLKLACVAEELAAWAIITEADLYLDRGRTDSSFVSHFDAFAAQLFDQMDFLSLFDDAQNTADVSQPPLALRNPYLDFGHWFDPFADGKTTNFPAVQPYLHDHEEP